VVELPPLAEDQRPLVLQIPRTDYNGTFEFTVRVSDEAGTFALERKVRFVGPEPELLKEDAK
jgi:hypothetical protein